MLANLPDSIGFEAPKAIIMSIRRSSNKVEIFILSESEKEIFIDVKFI